MTRILLVVAALLATVVPSASAAQLPVVDVLVLYTPKALAGSGSVDRLKTTTQASFDYVNTAFHNSKAKVRARLVALEPAPDYNPDGKPESSAAYDYMGGTPESAARARDRVRADVVALTAAEVGGFSNGQSRPVPATSEGTGKKILFGYDRPLDFFAHELGHILGLMHDNFPGGGDYGHARGYVAPSLKWRTIMAYETKCTDAGTTCPSIQYFSNPSLTYEGEQLGKPKGQPDEADEVLMLNESAPVVAAYR